MTYEQIKQQATDRLTIDWELAKSCPDVSTSVNHLVCDCAFYRSEIITNTDDTALALQNVNKHSFGDGYFNIETKIETDVSGYPDEYSGIEIDSVDIWFEKSAYKAKSEEDFNNLLNNEQVIKQEVKKLVSDILFESITGKWMRTPECEVMKLWKDGIISFEQLKQATYSDC